MATSSPKSRNVLVVGAGVIGLTTAIRLAEAKHNVTVVAQHSPSSLPPGNKHTGGNGNAQHDPAYTSIGSGGLWMPFLLSGKEVETWATATFEQYQREKVQDGVSMLEGFILSATKEPPLPWYARLTNMQVVHASEDDRIPKQYFAACRFTAPVVHMEVYLPCLERRLKELNVSVVLTSSLAKPQVDQNENDDDDVWDLAAAHRYARETYGSSSVVIVNCTGVGAGKFLHDDCMIPGRGVTVRIRKPSGKNFHLSEDLTDPLLTHGGLLAYAIPRGDEYTLGGTYFRGDWSQTATQDEIDGVIKRASSLLQINATDVQVTSTWTGLRPVTKDGNACVSLQCINDGNEAQVISNYGHSGSGVTTCWGCADHVVNMVNGLSPNS